MATTSGALGAIGVAHMQDLAFGSRRWYHYGVNAKQRKTLRAIFDVPTRSDIRWDDVESLFRALGAEICEGRGSRVRIALAGVRSVFHRPHPRRIVGKSMVQHIRDFLTSAEIEP